jgi:putative acetyltransferase
MASIDIRNTTDTDLEDILRINRAAFGQDEEAELVAALLDDKSARPLVSLLALDDSKAVGHILFTAVKFADGGPPAAILAPMAVAPGRQKTGIGGQLIRTGLQQLKADGVALVFVLGWPEYYPRHGFRPAGVWGFDAPYPIAEENAGAWMVLELSSGALDDYQGQITCADSLNRPELWIEQER